MEAWWRSVLAQLVAAIFDFGLLAQCGAAGIFAALTVCGSHNASASPHPLDPILSILSGMVGTCTVSLYECLQATFGVRNVDAAS